jgi:uncharacterized protein (TIGR02466 family)
MQQNLIEENVIFSTQVYSGHLNVINNSTLKEEILALREKEEGRKLSNFGGWQSNDLNLDSLKSNEFNTLMVESLKIVNKISEIWELERSIQLGSFWCNINGFKDYNNVHCHPGSLFSMVYYVECNEDSGNIFFCRPDSQEHYFTVKEVNKYTNRSYYFVPEPSKFLLFPSYVDHYVTPNMSKEERISIAINFV